MYEHYFTHASTSPVWEKFCHLGTKIDYAKGAAVFRAGDTVDTLYYILQGTIRMEALHVDGGEKTYWYVGPGCLLGETPFFHKKPSALTAFFQEKGQVCAFSRKVCQERIFPEDQEVMANIAANMAIKIRLLTNQIATLTLDSPAATLCKYFCQRAHRADDGELYVTPLVNQQELANIVGIHRVTCNRILKALEKQGVISEYRRKGFYIRDEGAFARYLGAVSPKGNGG